MKNGKAGAEEERGVDVLRRGDDALVEDVADLVGERLEHGVADLLDASDRPVRVDREPVGERGLERLAHVGRDLLADHLQQHRRRHRQAEHEDARVRLLDRVASLDRLEDDEHHARQQPVDDEAGSVVDEHRTLAELVRDGPGSRQRGVVGLGRADDLDERHQRDRVEEVHPDEALRVLEVLAHRGHRECRRVRGEHALVRDHSLELAEHLPLHVELLEDGLDHEVALLEPVVGRRTRRLGGERERLFVVEPASSGGVGELVADRLERAVDDRLVEVAQDDRDAEPAQKEGRELRGHEPGARDPDLCHGARLGGWAAGSAAGAPLDEVERVERRFRLRREEQVGERFLLGPVALLDRPRLGAFDQVERPVGRRRRAVQGVVELAPGAGHELARRRRDRRGRGSAARARS